MSDKHNHEDMPILKLKPGKTSRFEASRFLDTPETISAFLAEAIKTDDPDVLMQSLAEVAKARGINKLAQDAGLNRESLYKALKGGTKPRYETVLRLMHAVGVQLTVQPIAEGLFSSAASNPGTAKRASAAGKKAATTPELGARV